MTTQRMFVAVTPPAEVVDVIDRLPRPSQRGVRYTRPAQWHITVRFLGASEPGHAVEALGRLDAASAEVSMGPVVTLLAPSVVVIPAAGLGGIASAAAVAFDGVGDAHEEREYRGHLTIARLRGAPLSDPSSVAVLGAPAAARFRVDKLTLFRSDLGPNGSMHTVVAQRELAG